MLPNRIDHTFPAEELVTINSAELSLENAFSFCVSLEPQDRRFTFKLGGKSESFALRILELAELNGDLIPPRIGTLRMARNVKTWQTLRQHYTRMQQLVERMDHSVMLLGMDIIQDALALYRSLKAHGKTAGIEELLADIGQRFAKRRLAEPEPTEPPAGTEGSGTGGTGAA